MHSGYIFAKIRKLFCLAKKEKMLNRQTQQPA
ncbi:hypothetical protein MHA_1554 [Mannheimia haemolytica PHL213]|nr:hypothetical protein MHA_1554 [Mannheimia haemolytica PHL213]